MLKKVLSILLLGSVIQGCASNPTLEGEFKLRNQKVEAGSNAITDDDKIEYNKVRYIYRALMSQEDQGKLLEELSVEDNWPKKITEQNRKIANSITPLVGLSNMGGISMALDTIDFIFSSDIEYYSKIVLPSQVKNKEFTTASEAQNYAVTSFTESALASLSDVGYELSLFSKSANGAYSVYQAKLTNTDALKSGDYFGLPEELIVRISFKEMKVIEKLGPLDEFAFGFKPKYQTDNGGANIELFTSYILDEAGQRSVMTLNEGEAKYEIPKASKRLTGLALNRKLYRDISTQLPWLYASEKYNEDYIVFNGQVFDWFARSPSSFIFRKHVK